MSDVVIVGGGVIGAACALELAERGASVTLIERDHLAAHASGRNQGLWVLPEDEANLPMAQASLARYLEIAPDAPIDVGLDPEPVGMVLVANDRQEFHAAKAAVAMARAHGVTVDELETPIAIRDTEPALTRNLAGCWLVHHGHRMDPGALTVAMALAAAERGASIRHHVHARGLAIRDDTVRGVVTDDGIIEADTTIVAGRPVEPGAARPRRRPSADRRRAGLDRAPGARPRSAHPLDRIARPARGVARGRGEPSPDGHRGRDRRVPEQRHRHDRAPPSRRPDRPGGVVPADVAHA